MPPNESGAWFSSKRGSFLFFRVNRRPLREDNLFALQGVPSDVFEHFVRVLTPGYEVVTGHRDQRTWRVGGVMVQEGERLLYGKLGWVARGEDVVPQWSEEAKDWVAEVAAPHGGRIIPFGFDGDTRALVVLRGGETPSTLAYVFERILRDNEEQLLERTTEWSVEPILDAADFVSWLKSQEVIVSVSFTARLPNPEPRDAFRDLAQRMQERSATQHSETMRSDRESGLTAPEEDTDFSQAIEMGRQGFATLSGEARTEGAKRTYSQKNTVAREYVDSLPQSWSAMYELIKKFLRERARRLLDADE